MMNLLGILKRVMTVGTVTLIFVLFVIPNIIAAEEGDYAIIEIQPNKLYFCPGDTITITCEIYDSFVPVQETAYLEIPELDIKQSISYKHPGTYTIRKTIQFPTDKDEITIRCGSNSISLSCSIWDRLLNSDKCHYNKIILYRKGSCESEKSNNNEAGEIESKTQDKSNILNCVKYICAKDEDKDGKYVKLLKPISVCYYNGEIRDEDQQKYEYYKERCDNIRGTVIEYQEGLEFESAEEDKSGKYCHVYCIADLDKDGKYAIYKEKEFTSEYSFCSTPNTFIEDCNKLTNGRGIIVYSKPKELESKEDDNLDISVEVYPKDCENTGKGREICYILIKSPSEAQNLDIYVTWAPLVKDKSKNKNIIYCSASDNRQYIQSLMKHISDESSKKDVNKIIGVIICSLNENSFGIYKARVETHICKKNSKEAGEELCKDIIETLTFRRTKSSNKESSGSENNKKSSRENQNRKPKIIDPDKSKDLCESKGYLWMGNFCCGDDLRETPGYCCVDMDQDGLYHCMKWCNKTMCTNVGGKFYKKNEKLPPQDPDDRKPNICYADFDGDGYCNLDNIYTGECPIGYISMEKCKGKDPNDLDPNVPGEEERKKEKEVSFCYRDYDNDLKCVKDIYKKALDNICPEGYTKECEGWESEEEDLEGLLEYPTIRTVELSSKGVLVGYLPIKYIKALMEDGKIFMACILDGKPYCLKKRRGGIYWYAKVGRRWRRIEEEPEIKEYLAWYIKGRSGVEVPILATEVESVDFESKGWKLVSLPITSIEQLKIECNNDKDTVYLVTKHENKWYAINLKTKEVRYYEYKKKKWIKTNDNISLEIYNPVWMYSTGQCTIQINTMLEEIMDLEEVPWEGLPT